MTKRLAELIDGDRLWARHMALAAFGARADGGFDLVAELPTAAAGALR